VSDRLRVALVGGPMYDQIYDDRFGLGSGQVEVIVHADHPTLNRRVAELLAAGERIDVLATHSKYAPSQARWLRPLDDLLDPVATAPLAPGAVDLCRFGDVLLCAPRNIDVRVVWARTDRVDQLPPTWDALEGSSVVFGFPGRESGLFGTFFELVRASGGDLFDAAVQPTMATDAAEDAIATLVRLAQRAPADLPEWHYDQLDRALLDGRIDAAGAWPGGWAAIRDSALVDRLRPYAYPAGRVRRAVYAGCHAWAIPQTSGDLDGACALVERLLGFDAQAADADAGTICAHRDALAAHEPESELDRARLAITMLMIADGMITFPPLAQFDRIEDAGWSAINAALRGELSPRAATHAIQIAAESVLAPPHT
jgi:multiple sugar transport system substrate-binding protein